jgi:replicative superfamily II helicase
MQACVPEGVAFHHAGLTLDERSLIEAGFSDGTICVLVATSTLAAGVNLPAARVVIKAPYVGTEKLDAAKYRQVRYLMCVYEACLEWFGL